MTRTIAVLQYYSCILGDWYDRTEGVMDVDFEDLPNYTDTQLIALVDKLNSRNPGYMYRGIRRTLTDVIAAPWKYLSG